MAYWRALVLSTVLALSAPGLVFAQERPAGPPSEARSEAERDLLPATVRREASINVDGRTLSYTVALGPLALRNGEGKKQAEVFHTAYTLNGVDGARRPVTFVFNGGPGAASAYLHLGVVGPKRLDLAPGAPRPSEPPTLIDNPDTWLAFTDLVFIDPVGTGWSRAAPGVDAAKAFWTVSSDIEALAATIRVYLTENGRRASPLFLLGESYGGFRVPKLAHELQERGIGVAGLTMVSPVLDFTVRAGEGSSPIPYVTRLPSVVAARLERNGPVSREQLAEAEGYAASDYLVDLVKGPRNAEAVQRIATRLSELTGLDRDLLARRAGRLSLDLIVAATRRETGKLISLYDAGISGLDPFPTSERRRGRDPILDGLTAPLSGAMVDYAVRQLGYPIDRPYDVLSREVNRRWDFDVGREPPEAVEDLAEVLALDPKLRALVAHGFTDLVTPYFESKLVLDQIPAIGAPDRVKLAVYPGGHMFYTREAARSAFRNDARAMYEAVLD